VKRISWKWFLPLAQLVLASACFVYGPHEYRVRARLDGVAGDNNVLEYSAQHSPAPVERISWGINFPASVLAYPLRESDNALYFRNSGYTLIWISPKEIGFFVGIAIFWYCVGRRLDQHLGRIPKSTWPRKAKIAGLTCGIVFGILTGAYALQMIASKWYPERTIGTFGIVWSFALIAYFAWRSTREFRAGLQRAPD